MAKLTKEQWEELSEEEQEVRVEEKPDEDKVPTLEELQEQVKVSNQAVKDLEGKLKKNEAGVSDDLRRERHNRQVLETRLAKYETKPGEEDPLKGKSDDDILTVGEIRQIMGKQKVEGDKTKINNLRRDAADRMDRDEERMVDRTKEPSERYPIPYSKAMDAFDELVKKDASLLEDVQREALRAGGKPAERMYRIALTEHPTLAKELKSSLRKEFIKELETAGTIPKRVTGGGSGTGELDLANMDDLAIMKLINEDPGKVDKALGKK